MNSFATLYPSSRRIPVRSAAAMHTCTIRMSVDAQSVTTLRQLAMRVCGDALEFMRIAICAGGAHIEVWLCVRQSCVKVLSETIARQLPGARFKQAPHQAQAAA
ncbi:hypothetical protein [Massilia genomosp. 1]|uniref:Uncharacterized protein n=1 Tax=Massilia genomosp. 1 TaxID=2609280 RepID=A0ABX0MW97_9BURK|nr:hypothetical protein [Massilia genomosp. 1]NHZ64145.1 hypothetical protein [Massilia genomosp. 1]